MPPFIEKYPFMQQSSNIKKKTLDFGLIRGILETANSKQLRVIEGSTKRHWLYLEEIVWARFQKW